MPTGITLIGDKLLISYGEGDCKCKCLILNKFEMHKLLTSNSNPSFLTESMNITHIGYYGEYNCGDDAFMEVFKYLYLGTPHKYKFSDRYLFGQKTDICVLGGGDVINDYFVKSIPDNVNSIAVGIGIPYDEFIPMLKRFCAVYLRNKKDQNIASNTHYIPDLTFLLPKIYDHKFDWDSNGKSIGIMLPRTLYNKDFTDLYKMFCNQIAIFANMASSNGFKIVFIPFCIHPEKYEENDFLIIQDIAKSLNFTPEIFTPGN